MLANRPVKAAAVRSRVTACKHCGFEPTSDAAQFCSRCGTRIVRVGRFRWFLRSIGAALRAARPYRPPVWRGYTTARGKVRASSGHGEIATFHKQHGGRQSLDGYAVSDSARKVYWYLFFIADRGGYCWPFYKTIARRTHLSASTVGKALKELEGVGLLSRQQRASRRGSSSNLYRVRPPQ